MVFERIAIAALVTVGSVAAQQPSVSTEPCFEVVAVRPVPPNAPPFMREPTFDPVLPGGQFVDPRIGLFSMIAFAYHVEDASVRLLGLPDWAKDRSFSDQPSRRTVFPIFHPPPIGSRSA